MKTIFLTFDLHGPDWRPHVTQPHQRFRAFLEANGFAWIERSTYRSKTHTWESALDALDRLMDAEPWLRSASPETRMHMLEGRREDVRALVALRSMKKT